MHFKRAALTLQCLCCLFAIAACTPQQRTQPSPANTKAVTHCKEKRPQICTREYRPVCATRDRDVRCVTTPCPSTELKTYSSGCTACADAKVSAYTTGACVESKKQ